MKMETIDDYIGIYNNNDEEDYIQNTFCYIEYQKQITCDDNNNDVINKCLINDKAYECFLKMHVVLPKHMNYVIYETHCSTVKHCLKEYKNYSNIHLINKLYKIFNIKN